MRTEGACEAVPPCSSVSSVDRSHACPIDAKRMHDTSRLPEWQSQSIRPARGARRSPREEEQSAQCPFSFRGSSNRGWQPPRGVVDGLSVHRSAGKRGNLAGVFETYGLSVMNHRSGQSAEREMPTRGVTVTASRGTSAPRRIRRGGAFNARRLCDPSMPNARQSLPGPFVRSTSRRGPPRRRRICSTPATGSRARTRTALGWPSARVTALKHQYIP